MRNEKSTQWIWFVLFCLISTASFAAPLRVVTSTNDLASIAKEVGGDLVQVEAICRADQDPHAFEILPGQVVLVQQASVYLKVGAALDFWADDLIASAGNSRLAITDCSRGIEIIGAEEHHDHVHHGHVHHDPHPAGNPHYWLGPTNLPRIAINIRDALKAADAENANTYAERCSIFVARVDSAYAHWKDIAGACRGTAIVSTHSSWDYFTRDFGLTVAGIINPIPDVEPSPVALAQLEQAIRAKNARVFFKEPFASDRIPAVLTRDTGIRIMTAPSTVGGIKDTEDIWSLFDYLTRELARNCAGH
ncbi:zinc ABC transporter substrate-binding protein [candidate division KSB1 bacterium]|nr:MAG: zinc ABC transporter substrate-binding protein [candidate division KSB1 bacterium]